MIIFAQKYHTYCFNIPPPLAGNISYIYHVNVFTTLPTPELHEKIFMNNIMLIIKKTGVIKKMAVIKKTWVSIFRPAKSRELRELRELQNPR